MSTDRLALTIVTVTLLAAAVSGCTLQLEPPKLEVITQPAYPSQTVLVPFELRGDGTYAEARWELLYYHAGDGEWRLFENNKISVPNGSAGILQLHLEGDGKYQLTVELLTSRGGLSSTPPLLISQAEFYVDTQSPWGNIILNDDQGGGPDPMPFYPSGVQIEIDPFYDGTPDLDVESPVELYHRIDTTIPPTDDQDPTGDTIIMWEGGDPYQHVLTIMAIDRAGNIGSYRAGTYRAP